MIKIAIILLSLLLVGCDTKQKQDILAVNLPKYNLEKNLYNLYVKEEYQLKKYEPQNSSYLGMYIENTSGDFIKEFEDYTNTKPNVYLYRLKLGESYPMSWVLNCYSNMKMPFITILPPDDKEKFFDRELIKSMAKEFGNLHIPIFVNLYPVDDILLDKTEYIKFFQDASGYFKLYAPNASLVFSLDKDFVYQVDKFYPGDSYVDWVGIDIYEDIKKDNNLDIMFKELDFIYDKFSKEKPIFLNLGISHFGSLSYEYNIENKIEELRRYFYLPKKYNRIKMINYQNYDTFNTNKINKQNYLITDNKKILNSYTEYANNGIFSKNINFDNNQKQIKQENKLGMLAYKINGEFFVEENFLDYFNIDKTVIKENVNLDNKTYYKLNNIIGDKGTFYIDENSKKITIEW